MSIHREQHSVRGLVASVAFALLIVMSGAGARAITAAAPVSPNPSVTFNMLHDVAVLSPTDVWAVGYYDTASGATRSLTVHLEDGVWTVVPSPNPSRTVLLSGVVALSPTDLWAVGTYFVDPTVGSIGTPRTLAIHWDGLSWTRVWTPTSKGGSGLSK